jgi:RNA polymerase sigma factor (sigma-70 family)
VSHPPLKVRRLTTPQRSLMAANLGLVGARVGHFFRINLRAADLHGFDELFAAGCLGLARACQLYDPAKAAFSTYAVVWIDRKIADVLRPRVRRLTYSRRPVSTVGRESRDVPEAEARLDVPILCECLKPVEWTVIRCRFFEGKTFAETARVIRRTKERARQVQKEALERLRERAGVAA